MKGFLTRAGTRRLALTSAFFAGLHGLLTLGLWFCAARVLTDLLNQKPFEVGALVLIGVFWAVRGALLHLRDFLVFRMAQSIKVQWRQELFEGLKQQNLDGAQEETLGKTLSVLDEGIEQVMKFHERFLPAVVGSPILAVMTLGMMVYHDWLSGVVLAVMGPLVVVFMVLIGYAAQNYQQQQFRSLSHLSTHFVRTMANLPIIRAYGWQQKHLEELQSTNATLRERTMKVLRVAFLSGFVLELGATLGTAMVAVAIGIRVFQGEMAYFPALYVLLLTPEFFMGLRNLGSEHHAFMEAKAVLPEVLALQKTVPEESGRQDVLQTAPEIQVKDLHVDVGSGTLLDHVGFSVPSGGILNLSGPSGSGKTTLVGVLLGLRTPQAGEVRLNGCPIEDIHPEHLRKQVIYLSQHPVFISGTVRDNLKAAWEKATDLELTDALQKARLWDALQQRGGLDLTLSEGALNLSAGERARLALARAFLKPATLLVLDEPTAHLDLTTEQHLKPVIQSLMQGKTTVLITHRKGLSFKGAVQLDLGKALQKEAIHG